MDLHQETYKVQASIQISRQSQQRNQEGITSQSLIQSRIADTSVQNVGQRPKNTKPEIAIMAVSRMRLGRAVFTLVSNYRGEE